MNKIRFRKAIKNFDVVTTNLLVIKKIKLLLITRRHFSLNLSKKIKKFNFIIYKKNLTRQYSKLSIKYVVKISLCLNQNSNRNSIKLTFSIHRIFRALSFSTRINLILILTFLNLMFEMSLNLTFKIFLILIFKTFLISIHNSLTLTIKIFSMFNEKSSLNLSLNQLLKL